MDRDGVDGRLDVEDEGPAAGRPDVVEEGADRRRLPSPVGAEEAEGLALVHAEIDVHDSSMGAVGLRQLLLFLPARYCLPRRVLHLHPSRLLAKSNLLEIAIEQHKRRLLLN